MDQRHVALMDQAGLSSERQWIRQCRRWRTAEELLAASAADDPGSRGLTITAANGALRANLLVRIASNAAADMIRYAAEFGMTPIRQSTDRLVNEVFYKDFRNRREVGGYFGLGGSPWLTNPNLPCTPIAPWYLGASA